MQYYPAERFLFAVVCCPTLARCSLVRLAIIRGKTVFSGTFHQLGRREECATLFTVQTMAHINYRKEHHLSLRSIYCSAKPTESQCWRHDGQY